MKKYLIYPLLAFFIIINLQLSSHAETTYTLDDIVKDQKISTDVVDYFLGKISRHAKDWPLKFDNENQRKEIEHELKTVILALEMVSENYPSDQEILWRLILAHSMAYNLDIPDSAEKTRHYSEYLFLLNPENPEGNFFYGAHLIGIPGHQKEGIPYLKKAVDFGFDEAIYMLGFAYVQLQDNKKALEYFQQYLDKHPESESTKRLIEGVKKGKVKAHIEH